MTDEELTSTPWELFRCQEAEDAFWYAALVRFARERKTVE
jgi:hypothetical protein